MKITYDIESDAVYIYLIGDNDIKPEWVSNTYSCDPNSVNGLINLDFDSSGKLGGIEILDASKKLPPDVLEQAEN
jgi:uncharacterized protein YuzE